MNTGMIGKKLSDLILSNTTVGIVGVVLMVVMMLMAFSATTPTADEYRSGQRKAKPTPNAQINVEVLAKNANR